MFEFSFSNTFGIEKIDFIQENDPIDENDDTINTFTKDQFDNLEISIDENSVNGDVYIRSYIDDNTYLESNKQSYIVKPTISNMSIIQEEDTEYLKIQGNNFKRNVYKSVILFKGEAFNILDDFYYEIFNIESNTEYKIALPHNVKSGSIIIYNYYNEEKYIESEPYYLNIIE